MEKPLIDMLQVEGGTPRGTMRSSARVVDQAGPTQIVHQESSAGVIFKIGVSADEPVVIDVDHAIGSQSMLRLRAPRMFWARVELQPAVSAVTFRYLSGCEHEVMFYTPGAQPIEGVPGTGWISYGELGLRTIRCERRGPIGFIDYYCGNAGSGPTVDALWIAPVHITP